MKKNFLVFSLAVVLLLGVTHASANEAAAEYMRSLTSFLPQLKKNANTIWPGFRIETKPLLVSVTDDSQAGQSDDSLYALNVIPQNPVWQKQIINEMPVYYMSHDSIGVHQYHGSLLKPYFVFENQLAIVFNFNHFYNDAEEISIFNNEMVAMNYYFYYEFFHSPYAESKWELLKQQNIVHDGFNNQETLALLYLQATVLKSYLETHDEEALKDYAAIFQYRYELLDKHSQIFEVITGEPLAEDYIGVKSLAKSDADFVAAAMRSYVKVPPSAYPEYSRDFYYDMLKFTHLALEFGLDTIQPDWKMTVESENTPPSVLLQQHYHFTDSEVATRVESAKSYYGYSAMSQVISTLLTSYLKDMQAAELQYETSSGIELLMNLPTDYDNQSAGPLLKKYVLDSEVTLHTAATQLVIHNDNGDLDFVGKNIASYYFMTHDSLVDDTASAAVKFKLPNTAKVSIDGKIDTLLHLLETDKQLAFHQLTIESATQEQPSLSFTLNVRQAAYVLAVADGKLQIMLPKDRLKKMSMPFRMGMGVRFKSPNY